MDKTKIGIKKETLTGKMKRSPDKRHKWNKRAQGFLTDMLQHAQRSFAIKE